MSAAGGHNGGVTDTAPGRFAFMKTAKFGLAVVAAAALALAGTAGWWYVVAKPEYDTLMLRARANADLFALYDLQVSHRQRNGVYADDLESLLKNALDGGAALRRDLAAHTHLDTLVVAGDEEKFRLEANVRDAQRTLLKIKGPRVGTPLKR